MLATAAAAMAQTPAPRFSTVLWSACGGDASTAWPDGRPMTLAEVAQRARPVLWFSRDEPLMDLDGPLPREWPRRQARDATPEDLVYYRITKIKSTSSDGDLVRALHERVPADARRFIDQQQANPEVIAGVPLDIGLLRQMKEFVIRYLFYYPNELGAHSHMHDLEAVELRIVVEDADARGNPLAPNGGCRQIRVATLYGAAHGLGLYTNTLDLDAVLRDRLSETALVEESTSRRTPVAPGPGGGAALPGVVAAAPAVTDKFTRSDPFWPLIVFVEEGKHASAPDRNGDGAFTPNYDVNQFAADAWGARDTMRSRQLSPLFRADTFKPRIPAIAVDEQGQLRPAQAQDSWAAQAFSRFIRYDYRLRRPTEDAEICGDARRDEGSREASMKQYAAELKRRFPQGDPEELLAGKAFCDDTNVQGSVNATDVLGKISFGGAYNGFTHWWERISASARADGGPGWAVTLPVGLRVSGIGGWMVGRLSGPWPVTEARKSADAVYMPSASRIVDWYVATGLDYGRFESAEGVEDGNRFAIEGGVKFRIPIPNWGMFLGGRIGVRANGLASFEHQRLVFEFGAGIW